MSYTPTTEEVREVYRGCLVQTDTNIYSFVDEAQADGEFDRWLAEVKAQAWEEGYDAGLQRDQLSKSEFPYGTVNTNPYRKGEEQ